MYFNRLTRKMTNQPDHYYINQILEGNSNAFSFLVGKYENMVFTIALKVMGNREEAEDVAQEAFVKCYQSLKRFKGSSKFSTWLYRIAYNHGLDKLKEKKRKGFTYDIEEVPIVEDEDTYNVLAQIDEEERNVILKTAIKKLPKEDQILVTLFYFEELSIKEIAKVIGIKENNVKIKLHRLRSKLYKTLRTSESFLKERL